MNKWKDVAALHRRKNPGMCSSLLKAFFSLDMPMQIGGFPFYHHLMRAILSVYLKSTSFSSLSQSGSFPISHNLPPPLNPCDGALGKPAASFG